MTYEPRDALRAPPCDRAKDTQQGRDRGCRNPIRPSPLHITDVLAVRPHGQGIPRDARHISMHKMPLHSAGRCKCGHQCRERWTALIRPRLSSPSGGRNGLRQTPTGRAPQCIRGPARDGRTNRQRDSHPKGAEKNVESEQWPSGHEFTLVPKYPHQTHPKPLKKRRFRYWNHIQ